MHCPYCGEPFTAVVDWSAGDQAYIEDCAICCRPIEFRLTGDAEGGRVETLRDDD